MKKLFVCLGTLAIVLGVTACGNTWHGVKQDTKNAGQATGRGIERAGEKLQEISQ